MTPPPETLKPSDLEIALGDETSVSEEQAYNSYRILKQARAVNFQGADATPSRARLLTPSSQPATPLPLNPALAGHQDNLRSYVTERRKYGHTLFPAVTARENSRRNELLSGLYTKPIEEAIPAESLADLNRRAAFTADPEEFKQRTINHQFLQATVGRKITSEEYPFIRQIYAKQHLGLDKDTSDKAVFSAIQGRFTEDKTAGETLNTLAKQAFGEIIDGKPITQPDLSTLPARLRPIVAEEYARSTRDSRRKIRRYRPIANDIVAEFVAATKDYNKDSDILPDIDWFNVARNLPENTADKRLVLSLVATELKKLPDTGKNAFQRIFDSVVIGVNSAGRNVANSNKEGVSLGIESILPDGQVKRDIQTTSQRRTDAATLRSMYLGEVDPLVYASDSLPVKSLALAGGSAWTLAATFGGPLGWMAMGSAFAGQEYQQAREQNPEASRGAQWGMSIPSAAVQTVTEVAINRLGMKVIGGKIPGLAGILNKSGILNPIARGTIGAGAGFVGVAGMEYTEEAIQGATSRFAQDLALEFSKIAPDTKWDEFWGGWLGRGKNEKGEWEWKLGQEQRDTMLAILPLAVVGAGGGSMGHFKYGAALAQNRQVLDAVGIPAERIESIVRQTDLKKVDEELQAAFKEGLETRSQEQRESALAVFREMNLANTEAGRPTITATSPEAGVTLYAYNDPVTNETAEFETEEEAIDHWRNVHFQKQQDTLNNIALAARKGFVEFATGEGKASEDTLLEEEGFVMPIRKAVKAGIITQEQLENRLKSFILQENMTPAQASEAVDKIFIKARSYTRATRDGQLRYVIQLFQNADPMNAAEDFAEDALKRAFESGFADPKRVFEEIRAYEAASGDMVMSADYAYDPANKLPLIEGFSALVRAQVIDGTNIEALPPTLSQWVDTILAYTDNSLNVAKGIYEGYGSDIKRAGTLRKAIAKGQLPPRLLALIQDGLGINEAETLKRMEDKHREQLAAEAMEGFPEVQEEARGMLPHPETLRSNHHPLAAEVQRIWKNLTRPTRRKDKSGRTIDRTNEANAYFLPVGQMVDLDEIREILNEKGFDFETPSDLIDALDSSISYNKPHYGTSSRGDDSFSIGKEPIYLQNGSLRKTPSEYQYEILQSIPIRVLESLETIAKEFGGQTPRAVNSEGLSTITRDFEQNAGIKVIQYRGTPRANDGSDVRPTQAFVHPDNPGYIFLNADSVYPTDSLLAHEWLHNLSHDPDKAALRNSFLNEIAPHLDPKAFQDYGLELLGRYPMPEVKAEILGNLFSDSITGTDTFGTAQMVLNQEAVAHISEKLWEAANPLAPSSLIQPIDGNLSLSLGPAALNRIEAAVARKLTAEPQERAALYERFRNRIAAVTQQLEDRDAGIGPFARKPTDEVGEERRRIQDAIAEARAIIGALPIEARGRVDFDFADITNQSTDKGRANALIRLMEKADEAFEVVLKKAYLEAFERLLDLASPTLGDNRQIRGRLTPETQRLIGQIIPIIHLTQDEAQAATVAAQAAYDALENNFPDPDDAAAVESWQASLTTAHDNLELLNTFASLTSQTAAEIAEAHKQLLTIYTTGRTARRMLDDAKRSEIASQQREVIESLGGRVSQNKWAKRTRPNKIQAGLDLAESLRLGQASFHEVMEWLFPKSITARDFQRRARQAERDFTREKIAAKQRFDDFTFAAFNLRGASRVRRRNQILADISNSRDDWNIEIKVGQQMLTESLTEEQAAAVLDGSLKPGFEGDPIAMESLRQALADFRLLRRTKQAQQEAFTAKVIKFKRIKTRGAPSFLRMSDMEGVYYLQLAAQEQYLPALDKYGFTAAVLEKIRAKVDPRAVTLTTHLRREYDAQWAKLNPVHQALRGMDMPRIRNYAPGLFESKDVAGGIDMDGAGSVSAMASGFTKARKHHLSRPKQTNALAAYWASVESTEYFIAWAETMRDMRQVFRNPEVRYTIEGNYGTGAARQFQSWIDTLETDGRAKAIECLAMNELVSRTLTTQSAIGLSFNIGTVFKQFSAGMGHFMLMPTTSAIKATVKALASPKTLASVWNNEAVQQRIQRGLSPEDRQLLQAAEASPSRIMQWLDIGRLPISFADAVFTTLTGSAAYKHAFDEASKANLSDSAAHAHALEFMDHVITRTAQPATTQNKSLAENAAKGFSKVLFTFKSDPRQKASFALSAIRLGIRGDITATEAARRVFFSWCIYGLMGAVATQVWQSITRDDDDEQEWTWRDYAAAMVAGPISGIMFVGAVGESLIKAAFGAKVYTNSANPLDKATANVVNVMATGEKYDFATFKAVTADDIDISEILTAATRDSSTLAQLAGLVTPAAAIVPAGLRLLRDAYGAASNVSEAFTPDTSEDIAARITREEKKTVTKSAETRTKEIDSLIDKLKRLDPTAREKALTAMDKETRARVEPRLRAARMTPSEKALSAMPLKNRKIAVDRILSELSEPERKPYLENLKDKGITLPE